MNGSLAFLQDNERQALAEYVGRLLAAYDTLLNTHIVTTDRWDQMRRWAATLWQQVQRDGVPLLPESTLV